MKILFTCSEDNDRQLYRMYLENIITDSTVKESRNIEDSLKYIEQNDVDLVVCTDQLSDGTPGDIYLKCRELDIPFILHGESAPADYTELDGFLSHHPLNGHIQKPHTPSEFRDNLLKITRPSRASLERIPAFQKIKLVHFYRFNKVLCNVFLRLSDCKYVKIFGGETTYTKADIDKYRSKGVEHLYIANRDFENFKASFCDLSFLMRDVDSAPEETMEILTSTHMVLRNLIQEVGFSSQAIEVADKNIENTIKTIENNPTISSIFKHQVNKQDYIYDHGYLVAIVCCSIFRDLNWYTTENLQKLCAAAILHDITIENPNLAMLDGIGDDKLFYFSKEEVEGYLDHPKRAASLLKGANNIQEEVIDIIENHHELPDGEGLYSVHHTRLTKMSCTFNVAHHYVQKMYEYEFEPNKHYTVISELKKIFNIGNFKAALASLESSAQHRSASASA